MKELKIYEGLMFQEVYNFFKDANYVIEFNSKLDNVFAITCTGDKINLVNVKVGDILKIHVDGSLSINGEFPFGSEEYFHYWLVTTFDNDQHITAYSTYSRVNNKSTFFTYFTKNNYLTNSDLNKIAKIANSPFSVSNIGKMTKSQFKSSNA